MPKTHRNTTRDHRAATRTRCRRGGVMKIMEAAVFAASLMFLTGCQEQRQGSPGPETPDPPTTQSASPDDEQDQLVILTPPGDAGKIVCRSCPESQAEAVLIAELTIPGLISQQKYELPFRREFVYDVFGITIIRSGPGYGRSIACGPDGYHHSTMALIDGDNSPLTLLIDHSWSSPELGKGSLRKELPLAMWEVIGTSWLRLGQGASVKISYRKPQKL